MSVDQDEGLGSIRGFFDGGGSGQNTYLQDLTPLGSTTRSGFICGSGGGNVTVSVIGSGLGNSRLL